MWRKSLNIYTSLVNLAAKIRMIGESWQGGVEGFTRAPLLDFAPQQTGRQGCRENGARSITVNELPQSYQSARQYGNEGKPCIVQED